jgi:hypothetical protein
MIIYILNGTFRIMTDCADICCCRSSECAYDTSNSETGSEIVEEKPKGEWVPWYVWWFCFFFISCFIYHKIYLGNVPTVAFPHGVLHSDSARATEIDAEDVHHTLVEIRLSLSHPGRSFPFTLTIVKAATSSSPLWAGAAALNQEIMVL